MSTNSPRPSFPAPSTWHPPAWAFFDAQFCEMAGHAPTAEAFVARLGEMWTRLVDGGRQDLADMWAQFVADRFAVAA